MCECFHRERAGKISLKNVASTPTFRLSIGDVSRASRPCEVFTSDSVSGLAFWCYRV
jgi:hypothetical protein